jgi:hypothetical protein
MGIEIQNRKKVNIINSISDVSGRVCSSKAAIEGAFVDYFENLFRSRGDGNVNECLKALEKESHELYEHVIVETIHD